MKAALVGTIVLAGLAMAGPAGAQCRLALILGIDISSSVDGGEDRMQRQGLARALRDPAVAAAVLSEARAHVALSVFEWSGRGQQRVLLDWTDLHTAADLERAADIIAASRRSHRDFPTAIGDALRFAAGRLAQRPDCDGQTVDLSGDGIHNEGIGPQIVYRDPAFDGITVNGLIILGDDPRLPDHYRDTVLHGPGAFLETADGFADFERAMQRKLVRELDNRLLGQPEQPPDRACTHCGDPASARRIVASAAPVTVARPDQ